MFHQFIQRKINEVLRWYQERISNDFTQWIECLSYKRNRYLFLCECSPFGDTSIFSCEDLCCPFISYRAFIPRLPAPCRHVPSSWGDPSFDDCPGVNSCPSSPVWVMPFIYCRLKSWTSNSPLSGESIIVSSDLITNMYYVSLKYEAISWDINYFVTFGDIWHFLNLFKQ